MEQIISMGINEWVPMIIVAFISLHAIDKMFGMIDKTFPGIPDELKPIALMEIFLTLFIGYIVIKVFHSHSDPLVPYENRFGMLILFIVVTFLSMFLYSLALLIKLLIKKYW